MMDVELISYTKDADRLCGAVARSCYSEYDTVTLLKSAKSYDKTLASIIESGHHSVIEHAVFTFAISGISRVTSHQLVRHRMASYTQQSQRYVKMDSMDTVLPDSIACDEKLRNSVYTCEDIMQDTVNELRNAGIPEEDIRYIYPGSMSTNIVVTMNARSLWNFFSLRCCTRSQWEIRELADRMLTLCKDVAPLIFKHAGKPCVRGRCPEGANSCGGGSDACEVDSIGEQDEEEKIATYEVDGVKITHVTSGVEIQPFVIEWRGMTYDYLPDSLVSELRRQQELESGIANPLYHWYTPLGKRIIDHLLDEVGFIPSKGDDSR